MKTNDIVLICDNNYCIPTEVCIQSIILNVPKNIEFLRIHVCTFGLTDNNKKKLESLSNDTVAVTIDLFNENDYVDRIRQVNQKSHVTPTALIKFELPSFFSNLESILYLDGDIIIKDSIDELLNFDLAEAYMAASFEFWTYMNAVKYSLKRKVPFYFNSGVMLLNLKKMREDNVTEKLWYYKLNMAQTVLMDQESLNAVCSHKVEPLSIRWNFNPVFLDKIYLTHINKVYGESYKNIKQLLDSVKIIHYVGKADKPWIYKSASLREYWDKSNDSLRIPEALQFRELEFVYRSTGKVVLDKIKTHGIFGTFLYLLFLLRIRLGS